MSTRTMCKWQASLLKATLAVRLLIYGSGDFAPTVIELAKACGHEPIGLVDDFNRGPEILGTLETVTRSHPPGEHGIALAIGYNNLAGRWGAWLRACAAGYAAPALVHPRAYVADSALVGAGSMVMAGAVVDVRTIVDDAAVLWPSVCVNHDSYVGANCFLSPSATVCGFAKIGPNSFIGAGAVIADRCEVAPSSFIKMLERHTGR
jgi:acetyltransferase-like isoleucine patch superfamily enzyme